MKTNNFVSAIVTVVIGLFCMGSAQSFSSSEIVDETIQVDLIEVRDDTGSIVRLTAPAQTIVSLSPHLTELLFSLGVGGKVVATVRHSDFPKQAKLIPRLGDAFSVSVEAVVALSPDLIVAWTTGGSGRAISQLKELGFPVYLNEAKKLDDIAKTVETLGVLVGQQSQGRVLADEFRVKLAEIRNTAISYVPRRVFFQISDSQLYTVSAEHLIGQAIAACGATNVFAKAGIQVPMISFESVVAADPEIILLSSPIEGYESSWGERWRALGWQNRVRQIDATLISRPSLRMTEGIAAMCQLIN